jgi:protein O-GlcNAc transferase
MSATPPPALIALLQQGMQLMQSGRIEEARAQFQRALQMDANSPQALYALGMALHQLQQYADAESHLRRAVALAPGFYPAVATLGLTLRAQGRNADGIAALQHALSQKPDYVEAAYNLALAYGDEGEPDRAIALYRQVLALRPDFVAAEINLGNALRLQKRAGEALPHLQRAVAAHPTDAEAQLNLTLTLIDLGRYIEAMPAGDRAVQLAPRDYLAWEALGNARLLAGDSGGAVVALREANKLHPDDPALQYDLGVAEIANGELDSGRRTLDRVEQARPQWLKVWFERDLALPPLYRDDAELIASRARWIAGLTRIENVLLHTDDWPADEALTAVASHSAFYLNYQETDNTDLQRRFAAVVERVVQRALPQFSQAIAPRVHGSARIRVGFVSAYLRKHSVGYFFGAWITALDKSRFESFVWHIGEMRDAVTDRIAAGAGHFFTLLDDHAKVAEAIRTAEVDVLIHLDIGMHPHAHVLAALRLAPVQCAAYGHPVTTGLTTIDYYLTADLAEPADAAAHYTEPLVRLPKLGVSYAMPDISRRALPQGFNTKRPFLLCTQRLFKVLPHFDRLAAKIAKELPGCTLAFFATMSPSMNQQFIERISAALAAEGVDAARTLLLLPSMSYDHFLGVVEAADLVLDTTFFSGGNSSFDTFAVATPIVTLEAPMMRGRQTAAMLRILGLPELVAETDEDYVRIAVRFARDAVDVARREAVREHIRKGHRALFDDVSCVRALEDALTEIVGKV